MRIPILFFLLCFFVSCNFETKKISSQDVLEQETKTLNWKEVDEYPAFESCREQTDLTAARQCFESKVAQGVYAYVAKQQPVVTESVHDTIYLFLEISKRGEPRIDSIQVDSTVIKQLPEIKDWLEESIDSLPKIYPANKRGIPVATAFKMPVVINAK